MKKILAVVSLVGLGLLTACSAGPSADNGASASSANQSVAASAPAVASGAVKQAAASVATSSVKDDAKTAADGE